MKNRVTTDGITQNEVVLKRMLHAKFVYPCPHPNPSLLLRKQYLSLRERYVSHRERGLFIELPTAPNRPYRLLQKSPPLPKAMPHKLLPILISALILSACQSALPPDNTNPVATAAPHNLILYYHGDHADSALRQHIAAYGAEILYHYPILHGFAIRIPADKSLNDAEAYFSRLPNVSGVLRDQTQQLQ